MKRILICPMAAACVLAASSVQAALNLVQDPGFEGGETGTLTISSSPWYNPQNNPPFVNITDVAIGGSNPGCMAGNFNAVLTSQSGQSAVLLQSLSLTAGVGYTVNFWVATPGTGGNLTVDLNGAPLGTLPISSFTPYTEYNLTGTPVASSGILEFLWIGSTPPGASSPPPASLDLDNVSVAVPGISPPWHWRIDAAAVCGEQIEATEESVGVIHFWSGFAFNLGFVFKSK